MLAVRNYFLKQQDSFNISVLIFLYFQVILCIQQERNELRSVCSWNDDDDDDGDDDAEKQ